MKTSTPTKILPIRAIISGYAIFASRHFTEGEIIVLLKGVVGKFPTRTSIQIGQNKHLEDKFVGFVNHSCDPNSYIDCKKLAIKTLKPVRCGDELTINYNATEMTLVHPFSCSCKSVNCLGKIRGFAFTSRDVKMHIREIAPHLISQSNL